MIVETVLIDQPNPRLLSHPCFLAELSSGKTHSSDRWNRLRAQRGVNCWLLRQLLFIKSSPDLPPTFFLAELSSGTIHSSVSWNRLRLHIDVNGWFLVWEYGRKSITSLLTAILLLWSTQMCQWQGCKRRRMVPLNLNWLWNLHQSCILVKGGMRRW